MNKIIQVAKTIDEAIEQGLQKLNVSIEQVNVTVMAEPSKGFLGFGSRDAEVLLEIKETVDSFLTEDNYSDSDIIKEAKQFLQNIFQAMELNIDIEQSKEDDHIVLNLIGDNLGVLIGKRGQTLDALQYLLNISTNKHNNNIRFMLDAEQYRERRKITLQNLADRLANKVKKYRKDVILEPMTPYERKIIHTHLQDNEDVITKSHGQEPFRKIIISTRRNYKK